MGNAERQPITDWKDWSDVFASAVVIPSDKLSEFSKRSREDRSSHVWRVPRVSCEPMYLDRFCSLKRLDRTIWLDVAPHKAIIEAITPHIIFMDNDTMNFGAIEWQDGRTLIKCDNNKIIGGAWVAKINSVTIPDFREP